MLRAEAELAELRRHPKAPERCPVCEWTNTHLMNYGEPGRSNWMCHGCAARTISSALAERDAAVGEVPTWLKHAITILHEHVDLTDPNDPVGCALTAAGLERNPDVHDDPVSSLTADRDSWRARFEAAELDLEWHRNELSRAVSTDEYVGQSTAEQIAAWLDPEVPFIAAAIRSGAFRTAPSGEGK